MPDKMNPLHIIEPTLSGEAGHCRSFLDSVVDAPGAPVEITVWGGRGAQLSEAAGVTVRRHFFRRVRRVQEFFLLRRLLRKGSRVFIATAGRVDLALVDKAASGPVPPGRVFLFFHWVRADEAKLAFFRKMAAKHPELVIMGPTKSVVDVFAGCGFRHCHVVPYPITPRKEDAPAAAPFRHLLFAGAARSDKGFGRVVDLVALLRERGRDLPVSMQTSAAHYDKFDDETKADLERLAGLAYPSLRLTPETLSQEAYFDTFRGAVCLQPYNPVDFADRISGVTLDALSSGAPVVTLAGTWMARVVERFQAGVVIVKPTPEELLSAVETILADYPGYHERARQGGLALQREHSAGHLRGLLLGDGNGGRG
ncbi:hypothetical protein L4X63_14520 [Geomonas sp. Red32]|uniref:hypothetical protein n=1 Tax=Geomonas sp. Red32 TaxID=2912856 RepID=UPI00202D01D8|nr:hypothetical protein [Geomonas sp. Red32]MCM0082806.1 hypothetical protein [Geomonas sp. Red32]